jgi:hypothetical protein
MEYDLLTKETPVPLTQKRIVVGSFPTWALTTPDLTKNETEEQKEEARIKNGDIPFYYGTSVNQFWPWLEKYSDLSLDPNDVNSIKKALAKRELGITNVIVGAKRKGVSNFDYDLYSREYRRDFYTLPTEGETLKLLCTSKEVLHGMLFTPGYVNGHEELSFNDIESQLFEQKLISRINASKPPSKPISRVLSTNSGGRIECLAIPSPGSPFRTLRYYGYNNRFSTKGFLNRYLEHAFEWFLK